MFQVVNQKSIGAFNTIFGPSIKAVLTLSSKIAEMASILPPIILLIVVMLIFKI